MVKFREFNRNQIFLLAPSLNDWVPETKAFEAAFLEVLLMAKKATSGTGARPSSLPYCMR
jgi:hypothetical protein